MSSLRVLHIQAIEGRKAHLVAISLRQVREIPNVLISLLWLLQLLTQVGKVILTSQLEISRLVEPSFPLDVHLETQHLQDRSVILWTTQWKNT